MNKNISKVAVLGSGIMGSGIACHFANIGVEVLLLDICPKELNENEVKQNLSLDSKKVKNRIVNDMFQKCIKSRPSPIYNKKFLDRKLPYLSKIFLIALTNTSYPFALFSFPTKVIHFFFFFNIE